MLTLITPVGISLINNFLRSTNPGDGSSQEKESEATTVLKQMRNNNTPHRDWHKYEAVINQIKSEIRQWFYDKDNTNDKLTASAEIESTYLIANKIDEELEIHLMSTDTIVSRLAAELLKEFMEACLICKVFYDPEDGSVLQGFQTDDRNEFEQKGVPSMVDKIFDITRRSSPDTDLAINMNGGYKAFIPFLTTISIIHGLPIYYSFEQMGKALEEKELIKIPSLPVQIEWNSLIANLDVYRELANKGEIEKSREEMEQEGLLDEESDEFSSEPFLLEIEKNNGSFSIRASAAGSIILSYINAHIPIYLPESSPFFQESSANKEICNDVIRELYFELKHKQEEADNDIQPHGSNYDIATIDHIRKVNIFYYRYAERQVMLAYRFIVDGTSLDLVIYSYVIDDLREEEKDLIEQLEKEYRLRKNDNIRLWII